MILSYHIIQSMDLESDTHSIESKSSLAGVPWGQHYRSRYFLI